MSAKRIALVVNPRSGKRRGLAILDQVRPVFTAGGFELDVHATKCPGHAREIARTLTLEGHHGLCVMGGDGTVHEVVSGLVERGGSSAVPLGLIPVGTGNDVARHLGISDPLAAARRIVAGRTGPFDVMRVESGGQIDYCATLVGWVGVAEVNCTAERLRALGSPRYAIAALWQILLARRHRARMVLDDVILDDEFLLVAACNTAFSGSGMRLAPRARTDDGKIDVVILRSASRWQMFRLFARIYDGSHVDMPCVEYYQVRCLSILTDQRQPLDLDGEVKGSPPVSIQAIPGSIRTFCEDPAETK